jgi:hypothetical protein
MDHGNVRKISKIVRSPQVTAVIPSTFGRNIVKVKKIQNRNYQWAKRYHNAVPV